jgi:hypothetical protein
MWELRRLTTLWASTACYRDSFTFTLHVIISQKIEVFIITDVITANPTFLSFLVVNNYSEFSACSIKIVENVDKKYKYYVSGHYHRLISI